MPLDVNSLPAVVQARQTLEKYRGKIESGIGKAQTLVEVGGASYLASRLSAHLGGPEGKSILGIPIELAIGAACGAVAMSGSAGRHTEDVLAAGVGAIAAYTARLGFQAGLASAKPPADDAQAPGQVSGVVPNYYYLPPPPPQWALPPPAVAYPSDYDQCRSRSEGVGADLIDNAAQVLDRMNRG